MEMAIPVAMLNTTRPRMLVEFDQEDDISQVKGSAGSNMAPVFGSSLNIKICCYK